MWRNYGDVDDAWSSVISIINYYGKNPQNFSAYAGPGGWSDPDMVTFHIFIYFIFSSKKKFKSFIFSSRNKDYIFGNDIN